MPNYRRAYVPGGTYFFTVALADRRSRLLVAEAAALRRVIAETRAEHGFRIDALVVLPDHLHAVWTMPPGKADFTLVWNKIKGRFSRRLPELVACSPSKLAKRERSIWQRRFWEHVVRDRDDLVLHLEYCWANPVRHGLVRQVSDWPFSSFHREVARGILPCDWGGDFSEGNFGEPAWMR